MKLLRLLCLSFLLPAIDCAAQTDSATAAGSKPFKTGGGKIFWMGSNYRKEWNTTVSAPRINLATEKGGLTPTKRGGGKQTKSLRVEDPSGREYNLRSIQKFITSKTLPGDLQSDAAADLVTDGISASYPYSALSVGVLADAAGIPHMNPKLVYIGDDPKLGEYREDFKNMLALFEAKLPDTVKKGYDSDDVAEDLQKDNDNTVDQRALLKIRILDMFIMDLDRHEDQWEWGAYDNANGKGKTYYPIGKDRDQAFYINQGLLPGIIKWPWLVPQLQGFNEKSKNIGRFNFAARNLDRFFMNELTEEEWKAAAEKFVSQMTDAVIDEAINQQPREIVNISGDEIKQTLKERRKYLVDEVMEYYRFISVAVDVTASDKHELFDIKRNDDGTLDLSVYKVTKEGEQSIRMYQRTFNPRVTEEVRLYGFGGNDEFKVTGTNDKIKLRMIGGEGEDKFINSGNSSSGGIIYDRKDEKSEVTGKFNNKMANDTIVNSYERIYYKYNQVIPFLSVAFNQDDGLSLGISIKVINHGFRKTPYKSMNQFVVNHSLATQAFNFRWYSEYIGVFGRNSDLLTDIDIKAPNNTTNFFGYGDNTVYDKSQNGRFRYYRARYSLGDISLMLRKNFSPKVVMTLGPTYQFYSLDANNKLNQARYITQTAQNGLDPATLYEQQSYIGGKFALNVDTRDNPLLSRKGIKWITTARHLSGMNDASYDVTQVNTDFAFYFHIIKNRLAIANRTGGGHNFGDFEFYQAQYLGLEDNLRGYRKFRFAGRSKMYNNIEARLVLAKFRTYLFPGSLGILGFYDAGRIWADNDPSDEWLTGYGGGFWISPLNRLLLTFTYAVSKEDRLPLLTFGWRF